MEKKLGREEAEGCLGDNGCNLKLFGGVKMILRKQPWGASWGYLGRRFQAEKGWGLRASEEVPYGREQWWVTDAAKGPLAVEPHGPHLSGMRAARVCGQGHDGPELSPASGSALDPSCVYSHQSWFLMFWESWRRELRTFLNGFLLLSPFALHESNSFWVQIIGTLDFIRSDQHFVCVYSYMHTLPFIRVNSELT